MLNLLTAIWMSLVELFQTTETFPGMRCEDTSLPISLAFELADRLAAPL
jgi:hypothetical protein